MQKAIITVTGFIIFMLGFLSLILQLVGVKIVFLQWIEHLGIWGSFVFKILMVFSGVAMIVGTHLNPNRYDEHFDGVK